MHRRVCMYIYKHTYTSCPGLAPDQKSQNQWGMSEGWSGQASACLKTPPWQNLLRDAILEAEEEFSKNVLYFFEMDSCFICNFKKKIRRPREGDTTLKRCSWPFSGEFYRSQKNAGYREKSFHVTRLQFNSSLETTALPPTPEPPFKRTTWSPWTLLSAHNPCPSAHPEGQQASGNATLGKRYETV